MIRGQLEEQYEQLSFSGGGLRCFWQGGALDALNGVRPLKPRRIAAASGGALSAAAFIAGCGSKLIDAFCARLAKTDENVDLKVGADVREMTPHQQIYRDVVSEVLSADACEAVAEGPVFEVVLARPPRFLPTPVGAALTMFLYETDKLIRSTPHGRFAEKAGASAVRVDARQAARDGQLVDLVCIAATIPPVFSIKTWEGEPVIDAGTLDNAPLPQPNRGRTLVLLTRRYRNLPHHDGRTYLYPSRETPADKIDFTDAQALKATYAQGQRDVRRLLDGNRGTRGALRTNP